MTAPTDTTAAFAGTPLGDALAAGGLREVEVSFSDHSGHMLGKRIPASRLLDANRVAFCNAALAWNSLADVIPGTSLTGPDSGYPDAFLAPDPATYRPLPWRPGAGHVTADVVDHHGQSHPTAPRAVLRRVLDRLAAHGYHAEVGVEIEFYLIGLDRRPLSGDIHCYSLQKANELEPVTDAILNGLEGFVRLEGGNSEYGPGQFEVNIGHDGALAAADDGARLKYAVRELARREGVRATFMAKPFNKVSGSSMHLHLSLWKDGKPAFAPEGGTENFLHRAALGGILRHLPALTLLGAPNVNSYRRFEVDSFAPANVSWGGDNRTVAVRSLIESPSATRIELRTPASDACTYWAIAGLLAAVLAGIEDGDDPGARGEGYLYGQGEPLPTTLWDAILATRADARLTGILGDNALADYALIAESEWRAFVTEVSSWDLDRYLGTT